MTLHRNSLPVHNKLGEVPLDQIEQSASLLLLQELPQRMRRFPVHVHLLKQVELHLSVAHKALNLLRATGLLVRELVTRERQNAET